MRLRADLRHAIQAVADDPGFVAGDAAEMISHFDGGRRHDTGLTSMPTHRQLRATNAPGSVRRTTTASASAPPADPA